MKPSLFVRALTETEAYRLRRCLRGQDIFALRRAQLILSSARGVSVPLLSQHSGYSVQMVRHIIHAFNEQGLACLKRQSNRPKTSTPLLGDAERQHLQNLWHQSPRSFGKKSSLWSLALLAEVMCEQGLTPHQVSAETIRRAVRRLGLRWQRAKHWITSSDPRYALKKSGGHA